MHNAMLFKVTSIHFLLLNIHKVVVCLLVLRTILRPKEGNMSQIDTFNSKKHIIASLVIAWRASVVSNTR